MQVQALTIERKTLTRNRRISASPPSASSPAMHMHVPDGISEQYADLTKRIKDMSERVRPLFPHTTPPQPLTQGAG